MLKELIRWWGNGYAAYHWVKGACECEIRWSSWDCLSSKAKHGALCISRRQKCLVFCCESFYNHGKIGWVFISWIFKTQKHWFISVSENPCLPKPKPEGRASLRLTSLRKALHFAVSSLLWVLWLDVCLCLRMIFIKCLSSAIGWMFVFPPTPVHMLKS